MRSKSVAAAARNAALFHRFGETVEHGDAFVPADAGVGDALPIGERAAFLQILAAGYQGIDVRSMHGLAFGTGIALVAAAGGLLATYHPIEPNVAVNFIVLLFVAVVVGGLGSIPGAFVGGIVIGLVQSLTLLVLPFQLQNTGVFIAFLLVLYLRPQGLFGRRLRTV